MFTGVGVTVKTRSSTVRVHVRIVPDTFTSRRPHVALLFRRHHIATVCSSQIALVQSTYIMHSFRSPPPCQLSPPSVQRVAPAGRKTSKSASV